MHKKKNYVNNKSLLEKIIEFHSTGVISEELHMMFWEMCNRIIGRSRFNRYTQDWREDMVSDAYVKCLVVVLKFDLERTNPFAYFTTVISNCFLDYIGNESKQRDIKERLKTRLDY